MSHILIDFADGRPRIFPTPELLATVEEFMSLGIDKRLAYDREFRKAVNM